MGRDLEYETGLPTTRLSGDEDHLVGVQSAQQVVDAFPREWHAVLPLRAKQAVDSFPLHEVAGGDRTAALTSVGNTAQHVRNAVEDSLKGLAGRGSSLQLVGLC